MANTSFSCRSTVLLWLIVVAMIVGCTGRRITTAVEDQTSQHGSLPMTPVEAATLTPPPKAETAEPESRPAVSPTEEVDAAEEASSKANAAESETGPTIPVAEVHIAEEPLGVAPSLQPAISPVKSVAELADVYFDFDRSAIRKEARSVLEMNAGLLKLQPAQTIVVEGHCDERGTGAYNLVLGERRAEAVRQYLLKRGVAPSQIRITSYGKERPFCEEHSEDCWQSNRRAHVRRQ